MRAHNYQHEAGLALELGGIIPRLNVAYHSYGRLNEEADNVIWVCHAMTANSEVEAWWPGMVGPGKLLDPDKYFIVCANILGSCYGSTGPMSPRPDNGLPWYRDFPAITIRDLVEAHELLRKHLGINKIHTILGGSVGAFQALEYSIMYPELIEHLIFIAGSVQVSPWATAFNESQRLAIEADPTFREDRPYGGISGLKAARAIALLSYRNGQQYNDTQRETDMRKTAELRAASYQRYQGEKLLRRFDAYSYYTLTSLMDTHNIMRDRGALGDVVGRIRARILAIGISSDQLFPPVEQKLLAHVAQGSYAEIRSNCGHDGFLLESEQISGHVKAFWGSRANTLSLRHERFKEHQPASKGAYSPA